MIPHLIKALCRGIYRLTQCCGILRSYAGIKGSAMKALLRCRVNCCKQVAPRIGSLISYYGPCTSKRSPLLPEQKIPEVLADTKEPGTAAF